MAEHVFHFAPEIWLTVVDVYFEEFGALFTWDNIVVGYAGWYQRCVVFVECYAAVIATHTDGATALETHIDDEGVVLEHLAMELAADLEHLDLEVWTLDNRFGTVEASAIVGEIIRLDIEVDGIDCQLGMEFAWTSVETKTIVVEDAIGDVTTLLYFCKENTSTDGMDTSGWDVEDIALVDCVTCEDVGYGAIGNLLAIFFFGYLLAEAGIETCTRLGIDDVPHLGLTQLAMSCSSQFVVGMNLNAEIALGIDELDEERELTSITFEIGTSDNEIAISLDHLNQRLTGKRAIGNNALT